MSPDLGTGVQSLGWFCPVTHTRVGGQRGTMHTCCWQLQSSKRGIFQTCNKGQHLTGVGGAGGGGRLVELALAEKVLLQGCSAWTLLCGCLWFVHLHCSQRPDVGNKWCCLCAVFFGRNDKYKPLRVAGLFMNELRNHTLMLKETGKSEGNRTVFVYSAVSGQLDKTCFEFSPTCWVCSVSLSRSVLFVRNDNTHFDATPARNCWKRFRDGWAAVQPPSAGHCFEIFELSAFRRAAGLVQSRSWCSVPVYVCELYLCTRVLSLLARNALVPMSSTWSCHDGPLTIPDEFNWCDRCLPCKIGLLHWRQHCRWMFFQCLTWKGCRTWAHSWSNEWLSDSASIWVGVSNKFKHLWHKCSSKELCQKPASTTGSASSRRVEQEWRTSQGLRAWRQEEAEQMYGKLRIWWNRIDVSLSPACPCSQGSLLPPSTGFSSWIYSSSSGVWSLCHMFWSNLSWTSMWLCQTSWWDSPPPYPGSSGMWSQWMRPGCTCMTLNWRCNQRSSCGRVNHALRRLGATNLLQRWC